MPQKEYPDQNAEPQSGTDEPATECGRETSSEPSFDCAAMMRRMAKCCGGTGTKAPSTS